MPKICRNKRIRLNKCDDNATDLESQTIELFSSGCNFAFGTNVWPLSDHVHGFDVGDEFGCAVKFLESQHGLSC